MNATQPTDPDAVGGWLFFRNLKASRLMAPEDLAALERQSRDEPLANLQTFLVESGYLNEYQLQRILDGKPDGLLLGQYRVLGELGRGGFGQVFKARHALMDRVVAIKLLNADYSDDPFTRDLFLREMVTTTRLSHSNIAAAYDANEVDGKVFLVMEYVAGQSLEHFVRDHGLLAPGLACSVLTQTAAALQHAQECGLVHRDLKPANVMLSTVGPVTKGVQPTAVRVKVIDFGLASLRQNGLGPVMTLQCDAGAIVGTPSFIPPEQITDVHAADTRSDLYSLGCTLYYALTGRLPFEGANTKLVLLQHLSHSVPTVQTHRASIPNGLAAIVHKLMAKEPKDRYQTPAELIDAVNAFTGIPAAPAGLNAVPSPEPRGVGGALTEDWVPQSSVSTRSSKPCLHETRVTWVNQPPVEPRRLAPPRPLATSAAPSTSLRALWAEWCDLVDDFSNADAPGIPLDEYRAFHRELLATIRESQASGADLSPRQLDTLASLAEPWVTVDALTNLEPRLLSDLGHDCRSLGDECWADEPAKNSALWFAMAGIILSVLFVVGMALLRR